jgi:nucleotidyltransferase/DNA polymerase involved in DNA repair
MNRRKPLMKVVGVYIEHFAAAAEIRERPELKSHPIVIGGFPSDRKAVFECSVEAVEAGIVPGIPLRQAHQLCPDAIFIALDEHKYIREFGNVLDVLEQFSPIVEAGDLGTAFLDGSGLEGLFGSDETLAKQISSEVCQQTRIEPRIGIASNKFTAAVAATLASAKKPHIVTKGKERKFLASLPTNLLPISEDTKRRLDLLGLRIMSQIALLPLDALANQFGDEGVLAHQLANGIDERPLIPRSKPAILEQELSWENPLESADTVLAAIDRLLDKLIPTLKNRNQVCGQIRLCLHLDGTSPWYDSLNLKEPTDSKREITSLIKHRLETAHLSAGVTDIRLGLTQLGSEMAKQSFLLTRERVRQDAQLKRAAKQLQARLGKNPLKKVIQVDPGSRIPERRSGLIDFNP